MAALLFEQIMFIDNNGTGAKFDRLGIEQFSFGNFTLDDEYAQIHGLLNITAGDRSFTCKEDAGRTDFDVLVSECKTEVDERTGEHFEFTFNAGRLVLLEWWAPVDNYDYVRKVLIKRYGAPNQNCNGGSAKEQSYRKDI